MEIAYFLQMEEATGTIRVMKGLDREANPKHILVSFENTIFKTILFINRTVRKISIKHDLLIPMKENSKFPAC